MRMAAFHAKIRRDDPFRPMDEREIEAMVKRIAAGDRSVRPFDVS